MNARIARIAALLGAAACLTVSPARAVVPISVTFDIHWTNGILMDTQSMGTFTYDFSSLTGVSTNTEVLGDGYGLLSLDIEVAGMIFTMAHDNDPAYPEFPKVFFIYDVFNGFDYIGVVDTNYLLGLFELGDGVGGAYFEGPNGSESVGDISFRPYSIPDRNPQPPSSVPDGGGSAALLGIALGAFAAARRGQSWRARSEAARFQ
jgi:hypothetical protein